MLGSIYHSIIALELTVLGIVKSSIVLLPIVLQVTVLYSLHCYSFTVLHFYSSTIYSDTGIYIELQITGLHIMLLRY